MVYAQPRICPGEWDAQTSLGFWERGGSPNPGKTTGPSDSQQKNRTCRKLDFDVTADHMVKLNESEKRAKYQDIARVLETWGDFCHSNSSEKLLN